MAGERLTVEADTSIIETLHQQARQLGVPASGITREPLPDPEPDWQPGDVVDIDRDGDGQVKRFAVLGGGGAVQVDSGRVVLRGDGGWSRLWRLGKITVVFRATGP